MTNREWLESLSDEELAQIMEASIMCIGCPLKLKCDYPNTSCAKLYLEWLKAERSESNV